MIALSISGVATTRNFRKAAHDLREAGSVAEKNVVIDLAKTRQIDARFIGLLLVLQQRLNGSSGGCALHICDFPGQTAVPPEWIYLFALNL